jgi:hypothetical protein
VHPVRRDGREERQGPPEWEGTVTGALSAVSGTEGSPFGNSAGKGDLFKEKGSSVCLFSRESTFSNSPTCLQITSSDGCIRLFK